MSIDEKFPRNWNRELVVNGKPTFDYLISQIDEFAKATHRSGSVTLTGEDPSRVYAAQQELRAYASWNYGRKIAVNPK